MQRFALPLFFIVAISPVAACSALLGISDLPEATEEAGDDAGDQNFDGAQALDGARSDSATDASSEGAVSDSGTDALTPEECGSPPVLLVVDASAGPYCPFLNGATGGTCAAGQFCCQPPKDGGVFPNAVCVNAGGGGVNPCGASDTLSLQCADNSQCSASVGGSICCGTGTLIVNSGCESATAFTDTKCSPSCPSPQLYICSAQTECAAYDSRTTCTAFKAKGDVLGACIIP